MKVKDLLFKAYSLLKENNEEFYKSDSQRLLQYVLKKDRLFILTNMEYDIPKEECEEYFKYVELRKNNMPLNYILGQCEFMDFDFFIRQGVLIPRPDTEILVEEVLKYMEERSYSTVCDVCSGSGAIGISIAKYEKKAKVFCIDISDEALEVGRINKKRLEADNVEIEKGNLLEKAILRNDKFDVVVSNPPYISKQEMTELMRDVKEYEPHLALYGGEDGLDFYRDITKQSTKVLKAGGLLAYEIGSTQWTGVKDILENYGFANIKLVKDLAGNDRVVLGFKR